MSAAAPTPATIRQLLADIFALPPAELADDGALFSTGRLDSFHLIELLGALEKAHAVKVTPGEVSLDNLDTPRRMAEFLRRKLEGAAP